MGPGPCFSSADRAVPQGGARREIQTRRIVPLFAVFRSRGGAEKRSPAPEPSGQSSTLNQARILVLPPLVRTSGQSSTFRRPFHQTLCLTIVFTLPHLISLFVLVRLLRLAPALQASSLKLRFSPSRSTDSISSRLRLFDAVVTPAVVRQ